MQGDRDVRHEADVDSKEVLSARGKESGLLISGDSRGGERRHLTQFYGQGEE
jgi:hypothetical protein